MSTASFIVFHHPAHDVRAIRVVSELTDLDILILFSDMQAASHHGLRSVHRT